MDTTALLVLLTELREELRLLLGAEQADGGPAAPKPSLELRPDLLRNEMLLRFRQDILDVVLPLARRRRPRSPIAVETKRIIDERYAEPLTLDLLAAEVGRSKRHLASVFLRDFRVSVHAYLTQVRLNQALALIRAGEKIEVGQPARGIPQQEEFLPEFQRAHRRHADCLPGHPVRHPRTADGVNRAAQGPDRRHRIRRYRVPAWRVRWC